MTEEKRRKLDLIIKKYQSETVLSSKNVPILQEVQKLFNYLPREVLETISARLKIPLSQFYGIATFYKNFHLPE